MNSIVWAAFSFPYAKLLDDNLRTCYMLFKGENSLSYEKIKRARRVINNLVVQRTAMVPIIFHLPTVTVNKWSHY